MGIKDIFEARDEFEREEDTVQALLFSVKIAIQKAMQEGGVSKKNLSEKLGISPARVSQLLSDTNSNMTIKTIGKICHALGEDFEFVRPCDYRGAAKPSDFEIIKEAIPSIRLVKWHDETANLNRNIRLLAA